MLARIVAAPRLDQGCIPDAEPGANLAGKLPLAP
jgi:hypothetical protein